tara:strand:+ start:63 stop:344 length:282 start_codon:yes stop_codon:yes gene_type:complete
MRVQRFLSSGKVETAEDISLQTQLFAYIVAKHYGISLTEVLNMGSAVFQQSLVWAMAVESEQGKERQRVNMQEKTGNETITLDYSFLQMEDGF